MEHLTVVHLGPARFAGDPEDGPGWPDEGWDEYASASIEHIDAHPASAALALHAPKLAENNTR